MHNRYKGVVFFFFLCFFGGGRSSIFFSRLTIENGSTMLPKKESWREKCTLVGCLDLVDI